MTRIDGRRRAFVAVLVVLVLAASAGVASAETRTGGSIVVETGETVDGDLTAYGGSILVEGTVDGNLTAFTGSVVLAEGATVTGNVRASAGTVRVAGHVGGDVVATASQVSIGDEATIGGDLSAAGSTVSVAGTVDGDATLGGSRVVLDESASVGGDLTYDVGSDGVFRNDGTVAGAVTERENLSIGGPTDTPVLGGGFFGVYTVLVNLFTGALLLLLLPTTAARAARRVTDQPLRTGGTGILALVGTPVLLVLLSITVVGFPIAAVGVVAFLLLVWLATVFGRYLVGEWVVTTLQERGVIGAESRVPGVDGPWLGLVVGVLGVAVLVRIPYLGDLVELVVLLLGLGAVAALTIAAVRAQRDGSPDRTG